MPRQMAIASQRERTASKIKVALIAQRLERCALGQEEMTREELTAAKTLLAKCLPDLKAVEARRDGDDGNVHTYTAEELLQVIESQGEIRAIERDETPHRGPLDGVVGAEREIPPLPDKKNSYSRPFVSEQVRASTCKQATQLNNPHADLAPAPDGYVYGAPSVRGTSVALVKVGSEDHAEAIVAGHTPLDTWPEDEDWPENVEFPLEEAENREKTG